MSRLPSSRPTHVHTASFKDCWRLLLIALAMQFFMVWRFRLFRWGAATALAFLLAAVVFVALVTGPEVAAWLAWITPALLISLFLLTAVALMGHNAWRLLDSNRLVFLSADKGACLDVLFKRKSKLSLANHGRQFGATSAPALRASVAEWLSSLEGYELDLRAQNERVAELYLAQFPQLKRMGEDGRGHPRLVLRETSSSVTPR